MGRFLVVSLVLAAGLLLGGCRGQEPAEQEPAETSDVKIENYEYQPDRATLKPGDRLTWTNRDAVAHTVTAESGDFDSGNIGEGGSFSQTFESAGTIDYSCEVHPYMRGTVTVE